MAIDILTALKLPAGYADASVFNHLARASGPHELSCVQRKVLIACSARSGSTLLKDSLEHYGVHAREHFNPDIVHPAVEAQTARTVIDYANHLAHTEVHGGTFAIKGAVPTFLFLQSIGEFPERKHEWRVIFLRRKNIVRQAISMRVASITGQWNSTAEPIRAVADSDYAFEAITANVDAVLKTNSTWERIFASFGITPSRVFYEDFAAAIPESGWKLARFIGVDAPRIIDAPPRIARQSTELNDAWEQRYRAELAKLIERRE